MKTEIKNEETAGTPRTIRRFQCEISKLYARLSALPACGWAWSPLAGCGIIPAAPNLRRRVGYGTACVSSRRTDAS